MKVFHLSYGDIVGGAAIASFRIHLALKKIGVKSKMLVNKKFSDDNDVFYNTNIIKNLIIKLKPRLVYPLVKTLRTKNKALHSPSILNSNWHEFINNSNADIVNLHWIQKEMISIKNISQIKKPIIWTFHDMWPFCGAEHTVWDYRWKKGYFDFNRPKYESGFDLNKYIWKKKQYYWDKPFNIVAPSKWMADCAKSSFLFNNSNVKIIPHCIDLNIWKPLDKKKARKILGLKTEIPILLAGTCNSNEDPNKGFDLLCESLKIFKKYNKKINLVIFGQNKPTRLDFGIEVNLLGFLNESESLINAYNAADIVLIPSRIESFSNVALEAQSCGTSIVAYKTGGIQDLVEHKVSGYLARCYDTKDFAEGINWSLEQLKNNNNLGIKSRKKVEKSFNEERVSNLYAEYYKEIIDFSKNI